MKMFMESIDLREPRLQQIFWKAKFGNQLLESSLERFNKFNETVLDQKVVECVRLGGVGSGEEFYTEISQFIKNMPIYAISEEEIKKKNFKAMRKVMLKKRDYSKNVILSFLRAALHDDAKFFID